MMEDRVKKAVELYPDLDADDFEGIFNYCDAMRNSMNVYGPAPYIADTFGMDKRRARVDLEAWMKTYEAK